MITSMQVVDEHTAFADVRQSIAGACAVAIVAYCCFKPINAVKLHGSTTL